MSQARPEKRAEPASNLPEPDLEQPGAYLRRCREMLGLSLRNVYERTRLGTLEAIEREAFAELPPEPYLSRHVVAYARALGVREAEAIAASMLRRLREARAATTPAG